MACGDVLSLEDLQTAKKHQIFEAEVITGKHGGTAGGADIDYATNQVTGQTQKTLPAVLRDAGFRPAPFTFATGGTLDVGDSDMAVLWPIPDGGDGNYYAWKGTLPKTIPAASTPNSTGGISNSAWLPVGDITLRQEVEKVIYWTTPQEYGAVSYDRRSIIGTSSSAADIAAAVAAGTIVDSTLAIQQAVDSGKNVDFGTGIYFTSKPINQQGYTGDIRGFDVEQTGICKYTNTPDTLYGVDAIWILGDNGGGVGLGSYMRYKRFSGLSLARAKLINNTVDHSKPKAVGNFFDYTDVNLIPYGYGFYIPRGDHLVFSDVRLHGNETNFYSKDLWMSRLLNVWAEGGNGFVIESGTSYTLQQCWSSLGSWNTYNNDGNLIAKYYPFDLGGVYCNHGSIAVDYAGAVDRPAEDLFKFRQGSIMHLASVGHEQNHARRITNQMAGASGFTTGMINIGVMSGDMFYNRYGDTSLPVKNRALMEVGDYCSLRIGSGRIRCVHADKATPVSGQVAPNKPHIGHQGLVTSVDLAGLYFFMDELKGIQLNGVSYFTTWSAGVSTPVAITDSEWWVDSGTFNASSFTINNGALDLTVAGSGSSIFWDSGSTIKTGNTAHRYGGYKGVAPADGNVQMRAENANAAIALIASGQDGGLYDYASNQWIIRHSNKQAANEWSCGSPLISGDAIFNFKAHGSSSYTTRLLSRSAGGVGSLYVQSYNGGAFAPFNDATMSLGAPAGRWSTVYASTGSINTSDERLKNRLSITESERAAALEIKSEIWKFKFNDAINGKGGAARIHFGVGAQSVGNIMRSHGLTPEHYAFYCYDSWDEEYEEEYKDEEVDHGGGVVAMEKVPTGRKCLVRSAGDRYGIRYEELLCFIISAM